jgi:polysaccharide deacetylase 2 family uncharacterized protein YibQ
VPTRKGRISRRRIRNRKHRHILLILFLIAACLFFIYSEFGREELRQRYETAPTSPGALQQEKEPDTAPKIALVIDDLGPSKKAAINIFNINVPFTLSVLPHETFTRWIAEEGHGLGYDVIGHIPMEPKGQVSPGKGGLYTGMSDKEIIRTLKDDLHSVPHIKGVSNHMGSAFTEDERAMNALLSVLKEHDLFFLDSLTTPGSVGFKMAKKKGIRTVKRDVFLDNSDDFEYIEAQWKKLVDVAGSKGYAVGIAHAKKDTIEFLEKILPGSNVTVVSLTEIIADANRK